MVTVGPCHFEGPQGSVPGPAFFLIYLDDLSQANKGQIQLFMESAILYHKIHNKSDTFQLPKDLENL